MLSLVDDNNGNETDMTAKDANIVVVRGAYKRYGIRSVVLRGLNMTVGKGTIYAFLGPSGCGKTTLLSCIVGRRKLDAGEIQTGVKYKSQIGYMPQDLALMKELSIGETLNYYAKLFGLSEAELRMRKKKLFSVLELPPEHMRIDSLSGGQQRRVSLCVTLLHDPEFLILDEPTVGVDPVLSHSIWQHLTQLSVNEGKSIIITTHYIEEARQANKVGMMRGGILLAEGEPNSLMSHYGCETLESLFLQLSQKQAANNVDIDNDQIIEDYPRPARKPRPPLKGKSFFNFSHLLAHILKNLYWMNRNKQMVAFLLLLPIVQCTLYDLTVGRDPLGLKVGIVNDELRKGSVDCNFRNESCPLIYPASCRYMDELHNRKMILIHFDDVEVARIATERNHIWGFMHITSNYTESLHERIARNMATDDLSVLNSEVNIWMDMSNQYIGNLLKRDMYLAYSDYLSKLYADCSWPIKSGQIPIQFKEAVYGSLEPSFSDFAIPAVLQLFEFYLPMMYCVGAILNEKRQGILERNLTAGMTIFEQMIGHAIMAMSVLVVQTLFMMIVLFVIFDNVMKGSIVLALSLLFLVGFSGLCYGFFVSVICDSDQTATYLGLGSFFPMVMLSGMIWPYQGMHYLLRAVGWLLPLTLTTEAFRSITTRAWGITHPVVYTGFISIIGWILFFCLSTCVTVKIKKGIRSIM